MKSTGAPDRLFYPYGRYHQYHHTHINNEYSQLETVVMLNTTLSSQQNICMYMQYTRAILN